MKLVLLFLGVVVAIVIASPASPPKYTTKYDNVNLDEIINNDRLYKKYFDCLTNKAKCTTDGKDLKDILPDALATGCSKCSEKQKVGSDKVIRHMIQKKSEDFDVLEKLYDPQGVYRKKYAKEAEKRGIKL